jgi:hypothetical protein
VVLSPSPLLTQVPLVTAGLFLLSLGLLALVCLVPCRFRRVPLLLVKAARSLSPWVAAAMLLAARRLWRQAMLLVP